MYVYIYIICMNMYIYIYVYTERDTGRLHLRVIQILQTQLATNLRLETSHELKKSSHDLVVTRWITNHELVVTRHRGDSLSYHELNESRTEQQIRPLSSGQSAHSEARCTTHCNLICNIDCNTLCNTRCNTRCTTRCTTRCNTRYNTHNLTRCQTNTTI